MNKHAYKRILYRKPVKVMGKSPQSGALGLAIVFALILLLITGNLKAEVESTQIQLPANTLLTNKNCSGEIGDIKCYQNIIKEIARSNNVKTQMDKIYLEGQKIILDTSDPVACAKVESTLRRASFRQSYRSADLTTLCQSNANPQDRYKEITLLWERDESYFTEINLADLKDTEKTLVNDTRNVVFGMGAALGALWLAPESFSNFNKEEIRKKDVIENYFDNIGRRPVKDKDGAFLNYVLHPIAGAIYYNIARTQGASKWESLGYSVMLSTFIWEYGIEATVERPSIQDLIATPLLGAILGEVAYQLSEKIEANGGKVLGSKRLGKLLMVILNPGRSISDAINHLIGKPFIQKAEAHLVVGRRSDPIFRGIKHNYVGIQIGIRF
jgi:hypothetical protein